MSLNLLLKNGTALIYTPEGLKQQQLDIGLWHGKIKEIAPSIKTPSQQIIDLKGLHILPGVIDSQVHFREPGLTHKEDLETGTRSALLGGVTTIFEMPNTAPSTTTAALFEEKLKRALNRCYVNYAFYMGGCAENSEQLAELEKLPHCSGVKIFMGSSTGTLLVEDDVTLEKILSSGRRRVIVHSEDEHRLRERKSIAIEKQDVRFHHIWRDEETALISTLRLLNLARKHQRPVHVLHITTASEMDLLAKNKDLATVEVLPQHLTLSAPECYERLGTLAQQNPPIREQKHQDRLWKAINDGTVDVLGSDHAPHTLEEKAKTYPNTPSGMPSVQTLVPVMLNHVNNQKLSLEKFVELTSENQRRVFHIKNKGRIALGFDADFTIVDLKKTMKIENKWIASRCGWTPFDGMTVKGWPMMTVIGGLVAMREDQILLTPQGKPVEFAIE